MRIFNEFEVRNITFLTQKNIEYTLVQITETGFKKSILDATEPMRQYFKDCGMHDYSAQLQGQDYKVLQPTAILDEAQYSLLQHHCIVQKPRKVTHEYGLLT